MMVTERKTTVMMLDDEKFLLGIYKLAFEKSGYEVFLYYSAYDAQEALRSGFDPDIILFDITMPESPSGYEFLERIQKEKLSKRSMKVALTNEGQDAERSRTSELGADGHLMKSDFTPAELVKKVTEMFAAKRKSHKRWI